MKKTILRLSVSNIIGFLTLYIIFKISNPYVQDLENYMVYPIIVLMCIFLYSDLKEIKMMKKN